ncbi:ribosomal protein S18-alanine N-acetyltransferase [Alteromonas confluentis]|uniref:[Ribosomal protein bS18]-alanine N-acetyltransferase n=1 Tax=Alteromonas confluentis TaxID=1656094 RepID=A0A1E7Z5P2_9ALTE|nr:ribosomal protein S18-alanine N-acetyltransferase [Alteromonas confluentis]OFC68855.1 ribosomal-protein-alanine N-acetyltransferase [Alteromonas confluentis]
MSFELKPLIEEDVADAHQIHQQATYNPWSLATFADCLTPPYAGLVAINAENQVCGYAVILLVAGEATLMDIAVAQSVRERGLGKQLLNGVIEWCQQQQAESLWLEVRAGNTTAISLYQKAGFEDIEIRKHYYPSDSGKEDARIMRKMPV